MNVNAITALPPAAAISARELRMAYEGASQRDFALDGVTFDLHVGQSIGLVGPNGSGKSTLVKMIAGLYRATSGDLRVFGGDPTTCSQIRARVSYVPACDSLLSDINVRENLMYRASLRGLSSREAADQIDNVLTFYNLDDLARVDADALSTGQKRRITFASALIGGPDILLLDEPTTGVDIKALQLIHDQIHGWRLDGRSVILASHHSEELYEFCDFILVLSEGRLTYFGRTRELGQSLDAFRGSLRDITE